MTLLVTKIVSVQGAYYKPLVFIRRQCRRALVYGKLTKSSVRAVVPFRRRTLMKKILSRTTLFFGALIVALIACCPLEARAATIALSFTGGTTGENTTFDGTFGWAFTLSSPVLVTELGLWDLNNDGLNTSHVVTIWTSTGTQEAQGTIPSGTGATLTDGFRYVSIAPVLLPAGSYTIGGFYSASSDVQAIGASTITTASGVTYDGSRSTAGFVFPAGDDFFVPNSYFGPNFQFTAPSTPDSGSTSVLLLLGVAATLGLNLLIRRRAQT